MKYISTLIVMLTLICHSRFYSQAVSKKDEDRHSKFRNDSKGLRLKVKDLKTVEKNGKTCWTLQATLINNSHDTIFYSSTSDCEYSNYLFFPLIREFDPSLVPFVDSGQCFGKKTKILVPPSEERTVTVQISAPKPVTSPIKFRILLQVTKIKNKTGSYDENVREKKEKEC